MDWLTQIEYWHWWAAALVFGTLEMLVPGVFFLWIGAAAAVTGLVALVLPDLGWQVEFALFGILSVGAILGARIYIRRHPIETADSGLNKRAAQYVGRKATLAQAIDNGRGSIKIDDTIWNAESHSDLPVGAHVRIIAYHGGTFVVEPAD